MNYLLENEFTTVLTRDTSRHNTAYHFGQITFEFITWAWFNFTINYFKQFGRQLETDFKIIKIAGLS